MLIGYRTLYDQSRSTVKRDFHPTHRTQRTQREERKERNEMTSLLKPFGFFFGGGTPT